MTIALQTKLPLSPVWRAFDVLTCYYVLGLIAITSTLFAVGQWFGYHPWPIHHHTSYSGLFYSPIAQGGFLGLVIIALAYMGLWKHTLILVLGLCLANNRGGWLIAGVGLLAIYLRPWAILLLILSIAFAFTLSPSPSDLDRLSIWSVAWSNLTLWGNGLGSFNDLWIIRDGLGYHPEYAHNDYLQLAFELGLWSIPIFILVAFALCQTSAPEWPIFAAFCLMATFSMPLHIPLVAFIGALTFTTILVRTFLQSQTRKIGNG